MPTPLTTEVLVKNKHGLHMRAAGKLCALLMPFASSIKLTKGRHSIDAKSMLDIMSLSAAPDTTLKVTVDGPDAAEALAAIENFFNTYQDAQ